MAELDQQFIEYVVKNLVDHPDDVKIERTIDDRGVLLELTVNEEDMGRIIGKAGSTAKAIRTLLRVVGAKTDERLNLKIVDIGGDGDGMNSDAPVDAAAEEPEVDESPVETESESEPESVESEDTSGSNESSESAERDRVAEAQTAEPAAQEASLEEFGADEDDLKPAIDTPSEDSVNTKSRTSGADQDTDL